MNGKSVKSYFADTHAPNDNIPSSDLQNQVQQLFKLVEALTDKMDRCIPQYAFAGHAAPRPKEASSWPRLGVKRRRGNDNLPITIPSDRGTNTIDLSDLSVSCLTPAVSPPKFWLYLSGLHPLVTAEDIQKIASRCLKLTVPADVVRLVPMGVDIAKLSFISFKVGLDPSIKDLALDASTWPSGILFREFIDQ